MLKSNWSSFVGLLIIFLIVYSYTKRNDRFPVGQSQILSQSRCVDVQLYKHLSVELYGLNCSLVMAERKQHVELNNNSIQWNDSRFEENLDKHACKEYLSYRNYLLQSPVIDEESFPIAYSIVVHRDAHQVERMIRAIYRPQNHYCIHVDAKSDEMYKLMIKYAKCFDNVFLIDDRTDVIYADYTRLEADLKCMKALLPRKWKYLINLCGMDFPLKTNYQMVNYLRGLYPHQSAESFPLARGSGKSLRFEYSWIADLAKEKPSKDEYILEHIPNGAFWRSNVKNKMESYPLGQDAVLFGGSGKQIQFLVNYLNF